MKFKEKIISIYENEEKYFIDNGVCVCVCLFALSLRF